MRNILIYTYACMMAILHSCRPAPLSETLEKAGEKINTIYETIQRID